MTNIVQGKNKYCVPAVISVIAGISTDSAASLINELRGKPFDARVTGVYPHETRIILNKLGFKTTDLFTLEDIGTLYNLLATRKLADGLYLVGLHGHLTLVEVAKGKKTFLDNHTGKPIPASSAARLMQRVMMVMRVDRLDKIRKE